VIRCGRSAARALVPRHRLKQSMRGAGGQSATGRPPTGLAWRAVPR